MNFLYEFGYALRVIKRKLGFSVLCVLVIALGYTVTIPLYSMVKNFAYASLPFPDSDRLIIVSQINTVRNGEMTTSSFDQYQINSIKKNTRTLETLSAFYESSMTLSDGEYAERFFGGHITADTLSFAATNPLLGRLIQPSDEAVGAEPVVLLSYTVWQNYYAADPLVVGRTSRVNQEPHTIIGVMPRGFNYPQSAEIWLPLSIDSAAQPGAGPGMSIVAKLAEGVSRAKATSELAILVEQQSADFPEIYSNRSAKIIPFTHGMLGSAFTIFNSMAGMAFCIYLLVCLNIGNLLLIRANDRVHELAIRTAVGSSRTGLFLTVLVESFVICLVGAVVGVLFASWSLRVLQTVIGIMFPAESTRPFWLDFSFNMNVFSVMVALMLSLWLVSGVFAAWRASSQDIAASLGRDARGSVSKQSGRVNKALVMSQVVLSFFLLVLSGSYLVVFQNGTSSFALEDSDQYLSGIVSLGSDRYEDPSQREIYRETLKLQILEDSDFEDLSYSAVLPGNGAGRVQAFEEAPSATNNQTPPILAVNWIDSHFYDVYNISILEGRAFDEFDTINAEPVIIVDAAFVANLNMTESIIGSSLYIRRYPPRNNSTDASELVRVVGVAPYLGPSNAQASRTPRIYRPLSQDSPDTFRLIVKVNANTSTEYGELARKLKVASSNVDRDLPIYNFNWVSTINERDTAMERLMANAFVSVALGALILAAIGVYGLISRSIYSRRSEIGVRRAIGSSNSKIVFLFLKQALIYLLAGVVIGGGLAVVVLNNLGSGPVGASLFASVSTIFLSVTAAVAVLTFLASYVPARKIVSMEPGDALHYD